MMIRALLLLVSLVAGLVAAGPTEYSTDMVMIESGQVMQTLKLNVAGQKSRVEGFTAGPLGRIVTISRKDRGVAWTLFLDKRQYTEQAISTGSQAGKPDLANLDLANLRKENLGRETVLGYSCTKMRVTMGKLPNGQALVSTVWVADRLQLPIRLEAMGVTQENRNLVVAPQAAGLFEIPAGFTRTSAPGIPAGGGTQSSVSSRGRAVGSAAGNAAATAGVNRATQASDRLGAEGSNRINAAGDRATQSAERLRAAASGRLDAATAAGNRAAEAAGRLGTGVPVRMDDAAGQYGGEMGASIDSSTGAGISVAGGRRGGSQTSRYGLEQNVNRNGSDFWDFVPPKADAELCAEACSKSSRCQAWTWVNAELEGPTGHCWLKHSVPDPAPDDCCVSGLKVAAGAGAEGSTGQGGDSQASRYRLEQKVNRAGADYKDFVPTRADAVLCAEACGKESRCRAWTWVDAELEGPTGHCWLKSSVPEPAKDDCCVSGVKR
jgi:hypothetical protein